MRDSENVQTFCQSMNSHIRRTHTNIHLCPDSSIAHCLCLTFFSVHTDLRQPDKKESNEYTIET